MVLIRFDSRGPSMEPPEVSILGIGLVVSYRMTSGSGIRPSSSGAAGSLGEGWKMKILGSPRARCRGCLRWAEGGVSETTFSPREAVEKAW